MSDSRLFIVIRQTVDWANAAAFDAQLPPQLRQTIDTWNRTFTIPYHLFRYRVRRIAEANLAGVKAARVMRWEDVPVGGLVLPVDDDDWFAPDIAEILTSLRAEAPHSLGFRWESSFLETPIDIGHRLYLLMRRMFRLAPLWFCTTNNYAIVKSAETEPLFLSHILASHWFLAHRDRVSEADRRLSLMNRTFASRTSLSLMRPEETRPVSRAWMVRKYHRYRRLYERSLPAGLNWAEPSVAAMRQLMKELRVG